MSDRGGLNYRIKVQDAFSKVTKKFRTELDKSVSSWNQFKRGLAADATIVNAQAAGMERAATAALEHASALELRAQAMRAARKAEGKQGGSLRREKQKRDDLAKAQKANLDLTGKLIRAMDGERKARGKLNASLLRQKDIVANLNTTLIQTVGLRKELSNRKRATIVDPQAERRLKGTNRELKKTNALTRGLAAAFRRVVGVLVVLAGVRAIARGFRALVTSAIQFNSNMELARIGIASLLVAAGEVRDTFGQTLKPAEAFVASLELAGEQTQKLRVDALQTLATFEELQAAFQTAIAPGLGAGLNIDQIREFSVRISQAASALGVAQNQLAEEIRSILQGTITTRTTRIAVALGITNDDIRRAKEGGQLFDFLTNRFEAFKVAGDKALKTVPGLTARIKDSLRALAGESGLQFFEKVRTTLEDILGLVATSNDDTGFLEPNPEAVAVLEDLFAALEGIVDSAKQAAIELGFEGLRDAVVAATGALATVGEILLGVSTAAIDLLGYFDDISKVFESMTGGAFNFFNVVTKILVVALSLKAAFFLLKPLVIAVGATITGLTGGSLPLLLTLAVGVASAMGLWSIASGEAAENMAEMKEDSAQVEKDWKTLSEVAEGVKAAIGSVRTELKAVDNELVGIEDKIRGTFVELQNSSGTAGTGKKFADVFKKSVVEAQELAIKLEAKRKRLADDIVALAAKEGRIRDKLKDSALSPARAAATVSAVQELSRLQTKIEETVRGQEVLEQRIKRAKRDSNDELVQELAREKKVLELGERGARRALERKEAKLAEIGLDKEQSRQVLEIIRLESERLSRQQDQKDLAAASLEIERARSQLVALEAGRLAQNDIPALQDRLQVLAAEVETRQKIAALQTKGAPDSAIALAQLKGRLDLQKEVASVEAGRVASSVSILKNLRASAIQERFSLLTDINRGDLSKLEVERAEERKTQIDAAVLAMQQLLNLQEEQLVLINQEADARSRILEEEIRRQAVLSGDSLSAGFREGLRSLEDQGKQGQIGANIAQALPAQLSSGLTDMLGSVFDPERNGSLDQALKNLASSLGQQILQQLLQGAIARLLASLVPGGGVAAAAIGQAQGGLVPAGGAISRAHMRAKGYAHGGSVQGVHGTPPKGISRKDNVALWGQEGEFMMRVNAVKAYGTNVMNAINDGIMDPLALQALAGTRRAIKRRRSRHGGYAEGGTISTPAKTQVSEEGGTATSRVHIAAVVANERTMEELIRGGEGPLLRFLEQHAAQANAALRRGGF